MGPSSNDFVAILENKFENIFSCVLYVFKKLAKRSGFLIKIEYILPKKIKMEIKLKKQHWFGNVC